MSRDICICLDFLTEDHKAQIRQAAGELGFTSHFFLESQLEEAQACVQRCEVLFTRLPELIRSAPETLRWVCCSFAGVDALCAEPAMFKNPGCILTNSNCYGVTIAEHVVMVCLMLMRRMTDYLPQLQNRVWAGPLPMRAIRDGSFTVLGTGDIGSNVARRLRGMGAAKITGLSRSVRPQEAFDQVLPISQLEEILPETECLIMALPGTPETRGILNRARIALLSASAFVINVGRGSAVEQEALAEALNEGRLAGAALDVVEPEPLPADHFLWSAKNLLLTPHTSGNTTLGYTCNRIVEMFCQDLGNYAAERKLSGFVDRSRGY